MSDEIKPALPPSEWKRIRKYGPDGAYVYFRDLNDHRLDFQVGATTWASMDVDDPEEKIIAAAEVDELTRRRASIAILNHILPDSDPGKITREKLAELRRMADGPGYYPDGKDIDAMQAFIDALESYLPPRN